MDYENIRRSIAHLGKTSAPSDLRTTVLQRVAIKGYSQSQSFFRSFFGALVLTGAAVSLIVILSTFFQSMNNTAGMVMAMALYPPPDAAGVSLASTIELQFSRPMNTRSVENSLTITPTINAVVAWQDKKLVVKPVTALSANTDYTITIGAAAKDAQGSPIQRAMVLHFTTGEEVPSTAAPTALIAAAISATPFVATVPSLPSPTSSAMTTPSPVLPPPAASPTVIVAIDPQSPSTILVSGVDDQLPKSTNGGNDRTQLALDSSATPTPTPGVVKPTPTATSVLPANGARIGYIADSRLGNLYTGDWPTHLRSCGHTVAIMDIRDEAGFDLEGYDLIVIGWLAGEEPAANIDKILNARMPVLNAYAPLAGRLGQGSHYDPGNPGQTVYGKTINIETGNSALSTGFTGEVTVANETLFRVPILAGGTGLATVTDERMGVKDAPVWTLSENKIYFGFWYSSDGANHNDAYWTLFDRSIDYLLGSIISTVTSPTPYVKADDH